METIFSLDPKVFFLLFAAFLLWGSWANTIKMARGLRFELYYLDFLVGILLFNFILYAFLHPEYRNFPELIQNNPRIVILSFLSGVIFNVGTFLLIACISLIGMSYAYILCFGMAIISDSLVKFAVQHFENVLILFIGIFLIFLSISWIKLAYARNPQKVVLVKKTFPLALVGGILIGLFHPILVTSVGILSTQNLPSFIGYVFFSIGVLTCNLLTYPFFIKHPVFGHSLEYESFWDRKWQTHLLGTIGGLLWATGLYFNLLTHKVAGRSLFFSAHEASVMLAFLWGILIWKEVPFQSGFYKYVLLSFITYFFGSLIIILSASYG